MSGTKIRTRKTLVDPSSLTVPPNLDAITGGEPRRKSALLHGTALTCPACRTTADILTYRPLEYVERFAAELVPPIRCPHCLHIFALRPGGPDG